jgi:hypothetical protein
LPVYRCPDDLTQTGDPFYGPGNYASNNLLLRRRARLSTEDIPDGLAYTVLFAEKYAACSYWALAEGKAVPWYVAGQESGFQVRPQTCDPALPQTPHWAGIQVGLADGSVRLVRPGVSPATWYAAHTPGGHEQLGEEPYADWQP